jgi:hypothetical protein
MVDQIKIGDINSYDKFKASLSARRIKSPKKKAIRETVPFSNITYDFSAIHGELYWEEREIEYVFEMIADTPEELESLKTAFAGWVMNIVEQEIHDPFIPDYHYIGTFDDLEFEDDDGVEKTTATVTFMAFPYKIANSATVVRFDVGAGAELTGVIINNSSHRITPTINTDRAITLSIGDISYSIGAGTTTDEIVKLAVGNNHVKIKNANANSCVVSISFFEEVF